MTIDLREAFVAGVLLTPVYDVACSEHGPRTAAVVAITIGTERRYLCHSCADRVRAALTPPAQDEEMYGTTGGAAARCACTACTACR